MNVRATIQLALVASGFLGLAVPVRAAEQAGPCRIVSYNVWNGFQEKPEPRREQWLAWMAQQRPDVVALQELNGYTPEELAADARTWGHLHTELLKVDGFPTGLTSRTPITEVSRIREGMHHGLLRGKIRGIHFYVIHFHPSHYKRRIEEARSLLADIRLLAEPDPAVILAGDFNGFSPDDQVHYATDPELEPFFNMLDKQYPDSMNLNGGKIDYGGILEILNFGLVDLVTRFRKPDGRFLGTFPTELRRPENLGTDRRIDYVFTSPALARSAKSATIIRGKPTEMLSDHYPLVVDLEIP